MRAAGRVSHARINQSLTATIEESVHAAPVLEAPDKEDSLAKRGTRDRLGRRRRIRTGLLLATALPPVVLVINQRAALEMALGGLGRLDWVWIPLGLTFEAISFMMVARGQRRLFGRHATGWRLGPFVRTALVSNALSTSIPLAGPQAGAVYSFRRFRGLGAEPMAAGWALTAGGTISSLAAALLLLLGALLSGSSAAAVGAVFGGAASAVVLVLALAARGNAGRDRLSRIAVAVLTATRRLSGRPRTDPSILARRHICALEAMKLSANDWVLASAAALLNWLADIAVFAVSIAAVGASIPWQGLLLAYGLGEAVGIVGFTPGGVGIVEAAMAGSLMAAGVHHPAALASVLLYRLISLWLVTSAGWLTYVHELRARAKAH